MNKLNIGMIVFSFGLAATALDTIKLLRRILSRLMRMRKPKAVRVANEPGSADEFINEDLRSIFSNAEFELDEIRKSQMSSEELSWELSLERNLGNFYLPIYKRSKLNGEETSWDFVPIDVALPTVLIIGDSISRGYTTPFRNFLKGKVNVLRAPENCGDTQNGINKFDCYTERTGKIDLVIFNFGIHDRNISPREYSRNLSEVASLIKAKCGKAVFVATTPFFPKLDSVARSRGDIALRFKNWYSYGRGMNEVELNRIAQEVGVEIGFDFFNFDLALEKEMVLNRKPNDVHFPEYYYAEIAKCLGSIVQTMLD
jgi:hypothetical protein